MTKPKAKWGDARIAFRIIAPRVEEALRSGRTVRSVYEEMRPCFPAGYERFAHYARTFGARTQVRNSAARVAPIPAPSNRTEPEVKTEGPLDIVLVPPPAQFKHNPDPDSWEGLI